jgi:hypothetical protein
MYRGNFDIESANEVVSMNLAGGLLFLIWCSIVVVVIGAWVFKTLEDDNIRVKWDDEKGRWIDMDNPSKFKD